MFKSFRKWLISKLETRNKIPVVYGGSSLSTPATSFNIYAATGGYVVETSHYNRVKDRNDVKLYVITDSTKLGEELEQIVTLNFLINS